MKKRKIFVLFFIMSICVIGFHGVVKAKTCYDVYLSKVKDPYTTRYTKKIVFKKSKITVWGRVYKVKNKNYEKAKVLSYKKRVFKLNKKTKFGEGGAVVKRLKWKQFVKEAKRLYKANTGLSMVFVKKKGRIVEVGLSP